MAEETKPVEPAPKAKGPKSILVVAIRQGFYISRRFRPGQRFLLQERKGHRRLNGNGKLMAITITAAEQFSPNWMVKAADYQAPPTEEQIAQRPINVGPSGDESVIG